MRKVLLLLTLMLSLVSASPAQSKTPYMSTEELQGEVQRDFEEILNRPQAVLLLGEASGRADQRQE